MKQIKENAIANQKKIIAELRENTSCESSREIAIAKLNLIVDDYEKDNNVIDAVNVYLYYEFMSQDILNIYGELLHPILTTRRVDVDDILNVSLEQLDLSTLNQANKFII